MALAESLEQQEIVVRLGRRPAVVSREVARHGGRFGDRAHAATLGDVAAAAADPHARTSTGGPINACTASIGLVPPAELEAHYYSQQHPVPEGSTL